MAQNEIVIPISLLVNNGDTPVTEAPDETGQTENKDETGKVAEQSKKDNGAKALVSHIASKVASTALSTYGDITGNYVTQSNIQTMIGETGKIIGAVKLGWVGVAIYGVDKVVEAFTYVSRLKQSERQSNFALKRVMAENYKA